MAADKVGGTLSRIEGSHIGIPDGVLAGKTPAVGHAQLVRHIDLIFRLPRRHKGIVERPGPVLVLVKRQLQRLFAPD